MPPPPPPPPKEKKITQTLNIIIINLLTMDMNFAH